MYEIATAINPIPIKINTGLSTDNEVPLSLELVELFKCREPPIINVNFAFALKHVRNSPEFAFGGLILKPNLFRPQGC
jgi:hypothetical protein